MVWCTMITSINFEQLKPELINLTGVRLLVLFSLLIESPKSAEEINEYFKKNNYPNNAFSIDTLRNDLKALRDSGCVISRADKSNNFKYKLTTHPFELVITLRIAKSMAKLYNNICKDLDCYQLLQFDNLFNTLASYTKNEDIAEFLRGISLLKNINKELYRDLIKAKELKNKISFTYKSPKQNLKIDFLVENLEIRSKKIYISGYCFNFKSNSFLLVSKIISPITFYLQKELIEEYTQTITYELKNVSFENYKQNPNETVKKREDNKIIIEFKSDNEFKLIQKILSYGDDCTVISPLHIREKVINILKEMQALYEE